MNRMFKLHLSDQSFNILHSFAVFFFQRDVWIIKKYRDLKIFRKIFQHITAARCTAAVKEKPWNFMFFFYVCKEGIQFPLIISFIHHLSFL